MNKKKIQKKKPINFNGSVGRSRVVPTSFLPSDAKRITKEDGTRVWLIRGKEYVSKAEFLQYTRDLIAMADLIQVALETGKDPAAASPEEQTAKPTTEIISSDLLPSGHLYADQDKDGNQRVFVPPADHEKAVEAFQAEPTEDGIAKKISTALNEVQHKQFLRKVSK